VFNSLTGRVTETTRYGVRLQTAGIEWDLETTAQTIARFSTELAEVRIFIHLLHREDSMKLFGFWSVHERALFLELMKVSGIGPKQALRILSAAGTDRLPAILEAGDVDGLSALPGIGRKTAQKILVTLQGKLALGDTSESSSGGEIVAALIDMGFDRKAAQTAAADAERSVLADGIETQAREAETLRRAIIALSTR
jgi:holliday junction DNA helicase RuvA